AVRERLLSEEGRYSCSDECGSRLAERRGSGPQDQCPSVLDCLAGPRREVCEERPHGEGEGLRFYSHDTYALRPPITDHSGIGGRQGPLNGVRNCFLPPPPAPLFELTTCGQGAPSHLHKSDAGAQLRQS